jgi:metal-dependent amidase/aminoacylase/carboxypeptidase family protein
MDGVDAVFGFHNLPTLATGVVGGRAGTIMAGSAQFHITLRGRGGHAAVPQGNIDPVVAAAHLITALQARWPPRLLHWC